MTIAKVSEERTISKMAIKEEVREWRQERDMVVLAEMDYEIVTKPSQSHKYMLNKRQQKEYYKKMTASSLREMQ